MGDFVVCFLGWFLLMVGNLLGASSHWRGIFSHNVGLGLVTTSSPHPKSLARMVCDLFYPFRVRSCDLRRRFVKSSVECAVCLL